MMSGLSKHLVFALSVLFLCFLCLFVAIPQQSHGFVGNEFYANLDLPVGSHTVRIIARDIHGESTTLSVCGGAL